MPGATAIDVYLASASPRRRELLAQIGVRFDVLGPAEVDERRDPGEPAADYVERVARAKATAGAFLRAERGLAPLPVVAADTVVIIDRDVLGKPRDAAQAGAFLHQLSGRAHEVRTCVVVADAGGGLRCETSVSRVVFRALDDAEIARYVATGEPYDKAGGYAIQGRAAIFAERIEGSYSGIMGLPLAPTARLLAQAGVQLIRP
jgi:septum formation protein